MRKRITIGLALIAVLAGIVAFDQAVGQPVIGILVLLAATLLAEHELLRMMGTTARGTRWVVFAATSGMFLARTWSERPVEPIDIGETAVAVFIVGVLLILVDSALRPTT